jgi:hypothetical protein
MIDKKVAAGIAGVAVVGILSYLGYKVFREISNISFDDLDWSDSDINLAEYHQWLKDNDNVKR